eukprot:scaffold1745_cov358-Prasinococcus_capsulatus_cf.AAC.3
MISRVIGGDAGQFRPRRSRAAAPRQAAEGKARRSLLRLHSCGRTVGRELRLRMGLRRGGDICPRPLGEPLCRTVRAFVGLGGFPVGRRCGWAGWPERRDGERA